MISAEKQKRARAFWERIMELREGVDTPLIGSIPHNSLSWLQRWRSPEAIHRYLVLLDEGLTMQEIKIQLEKEGLIKFREGITIFQSDTPLEDAKPAVPYPKAPKVRDSPDLIRSRIKALVAVLNQEIAVAQHNERLIANPNIGSVKDLLRANYKRQIEGILKTIGLIEAEMTKLHALQVA